MSYLLNLYFLMFVNKISLLHKKKQQQQQNASQRKRNKEEKKEENKFHNCRKI
jgi:hypothetical protein